MVVAEGSTGNMLRTGFGIDVARRGLELLSTAVRQYVLESFRLADAIKDQARNLDLSNRAYQVLGNLLTDAGGDVAMLTQALTINNRSLVDARTLGSAAAGAYRQLGLDVAALERLPAERRLELIGRAVASATDRTQAFDAASKILGTRGLPTLLGALRDLAEQGWDKVADAQERAGRVMSDDAINRLEAAKKNIEKLRQSIVIGFGETVGTADRILEAFALDKLGTLKALAAYAAGPTAGTAALSMHLARTLPQTPPQTDNRDGGAAQRELALKQDLTRAEYDLAAALLHRQTVEGDPNRTDYQKREHLLDLMRRELELREKLAAALRAAPLDGVETPEARDLKLLKLEEQNKQLRAQLQRMEFGTATFDREQATRDNFARFQEEGGPLNFGGAARLGAMDWVTSLGTAGEQVSASLQSSLGMTVSGIGAGIRGWLTGLEDVEDIGLQLLDSLFTQMLDTIVQIGLQWVVNQLLIKTGMSSTHAMGETLRLQRVSATAAEGAAAQAAMTPAAATSSIASFGAAAALGVAALVAAMALFGGFATGGYTGDGARDQVAGVVHGQEYVLNAAATSRLGRGFLDAVNAGAPVASTPPPAVLAGGSAADAGAGGGAGVGVNVSVAVVLDDSAAMAWLSTRTGKKILYRKLGQDRNELGLPS